MDISFFIRGLLIGLSIAAAVGPISILCIQRTLERGRLYGLVSGLGAATADAFYGSIAAFGLTVISTFFAQPTSLDTFAGWDFSALSGHKDLPNTTCRKSSRSAHAYLSRCVSLHIPAHAYQSDDHTLVRCYLRRDWRGRCQQKLSFCRNCGGGSLPWFGALVGYSHQWGEPITYKIYATLVVMD